MRKDAQRIAQHAQETEVSDW